MTTNTTDGRKNMNPEKQIESMNVQELNELYEQIWLENETFYRDTGLDNEGLKGILRYISEQIRQRY